MQAMCSIEDVGAEQTAPAGWALVVDDNAMDRLTAGTFVKRATGLHVLYAADGKEALKALKQGTPSIVLTDMLMPKIDGLELVDDIAINYPIVPVILMTSQGSEEIAIEALRRGAASYVPKRNIERLMEVLPRVLARAKATVGVRNSTNSSSIWTTTSFSKMTP